MTVSKITAYHRPQNLDSALQLLREGRGSIRPLAGGTSLLGTRGEAAEAVVDLADLHLDWIVTHEDGGLSLGAMTTLADLVTDDAVRDYAGGVIALAARHTSASVVRNRATLGGTLVGRATSGDLVATLLALDATITLIRNSEQSVPLSDLYRRRDYLLQAGSLLTEVRLPPLVATSACTLARIARTPMDQPILTVAACVEWEANRIREARVAAAGFGPEPARLTHVEEALRNSEPGSESFHAAIAKAAEGLEIQDDHLASAKYRAAMLPVLVRRAVEQGKK